VTQAFIGLSGIAGLDPVPSRHVLRRRGVHPSVGLPLGDIGHDAAAVLIRDGRVAFAVEEERLERVKHVVAFPRRALRACLDRAPDAALAFYLDPNDRHLERRLAGARDPAAIRAEYADVRLALDTQHRGLPPIARVDHHLAHAASAFHPSGFDRALVVVLDGQGESSSISVFTGDERGFHPVTSLGIESSLGYLYAHATAHLGFEPLEDEYKVMGLAALAGDTDEHRAFFDDVIVLQDEGRFVIPCLLEPMKRFRDWTDRLGPQRRAGEAILDRHIAIAASLQRALERTVMRFLEAHRAESQQLCLAGGVALNCTMNGVLDRSRMFDAMFVQPAAGDSGAALGAALIAGGGGRHRLEHVYLGPSFTETEVDRALERFRDRLMWERPADFTTTVAEALRAGEIVAWFHGAMELGPRALGNRSILAEPTRAHMKDRMNRAVKKREDFRPFAPSIIAEAADDFFDLRTLAQYEFMTIAAPVRPEKREMIPAVVHVDGTSRVHVVRREVNPRFWALLAKMGELGGPPVLLDTSFNVRGEPIVCTPEEAILCFLGTEIDQLAIEGRLVRKV
jgi:carbamoyltransferase